MLKFMRKIPGGLLLVPMLVSALFNTFAPGLFNYGTVSEAFLTTKGINYIIGAVCFCSATTLDIPRLAQVIKKQGTMIAVKILICFAAGYLFIQWLGIDGWLGVNAIAFIACICSTNPALYLALTNDYGEEGDDSAFGLMGLICVPAFPLLVYSVSRSAGVDWASIISVLIPIVMGAVIGNLDKDMAKFFVSGMGILTPMMGWVFGAGINLVDGLKAGPQGVLLTLLFYVLMMIPIFLVERYGLKASGVNAIAMSSVAGLAVSVPKLIAQVDPAAAEFQAVATAQIAFAVILTSVLTPVILSFFVKRAHLQKRSTDV